jgi:hypothetical protein
MARGRPAGTTKELLEARRTSEELRHGMTRAARTVAKLAAEGDPGASVFLLSLQAVGGLAPWLNPYTGESSVATQSQGLLDG